MAKSLSQYRAHLAEIVGDDGKVDGWIDSRGQRHFAIKCRYCPDGSTGPYAGKLRVEGERVNDVAVVWLAHEASAEHRAHLPLPRR